MPFRIRFTCFLFCFLLFPVLKMESEPTERSYFICFTSLYHEESGLQKSLKIEFKTKNRILFFLLLKLKQYLKNRTCSKKRRENQRFWFLGSKRGKCKKTWFWRKKSDEICCGSESRSESGSGSESGSSWLGVWAAWRASARPGIVPVLRVQQDSDWSSLIVRSDVDLLRTLLLGREPPAVDVMRAFLLLLRLGALLLQLLPLELRPPVLEPDFYLRGRRGGQEGQQGPGGGRKTPVRKTR